LNIKIKKNLTKKTLNPIEKKNLTPSAQKLNYSPPLMITTSEFQKDQN